MSAPPRRIIPELDGLRGIAILLVFLTHFVALQLPIDARGVDGAVRWVARFGWTGVDLFFVLSGFLITGILLDTKGEPGYWRNYAARRCLRIFPLYYGALVLVLLVLPRVVHWDDSRYAILQANQAWYWTYLVNFMEVIKGPGSAALNTSHFWSLCIEEQFYLVWPLVVLAASRRALLWIAAAACVGGLAFRWWLVRTPLDPQAAYVLTPGRLDGLMLGAALAVAARQGGLERWQGTARRLFAGSATLVVALAGWRGMEYRDPVMAVAGFPLIAVAFGSLLVLALTTQGRFARLLRTPHLGAWGRYSYGLYLMHYPLLGAIEQKLGAPLARLTWKGSHLPAVGVICGIGIPLAFGMAWCSYHFYEKRFLALKRFFV